MKKNFFEEDRELFDEKDRIRAERIINDLTPEFAPEARFDFRSAKKRRRIFDPRRALRLIAAAAVLAAGIFLGICGGGDSVRAAENMEIVKRALADLNASGNCRIKFTALMKERRKPRDIEIYKISSDGMLIGATIDVSRSGGDIAIRIEWNDSKRSTQIFENDRYRLLENGEVAEEFRSSSQFELLELLDFEKVKAIFAEFESRAVMTLKDNGDLIEMTVTEPENTHSAKHPAVITAVFSKSKGALLKARVECIVDGAAATLLDVTEIEYGI